GNMDLLQQQFSNDARTLDGQKSDCLFARESGAGAKDVCDQLRGRVPFALVDDSALCPESVAVLRIGGLGDEEDLDSVAGEGEGGGQPRDAGAEDQNGVVGAILQRHATY